MEQSTDDADGEDDEDYRQDLPVKRKRTSGGKPRKGAPALTVTFGSKIYCS